MDHKSRVLERKHLMCEFFSVVPYLSSNLALNEVPSSPGFGASEPPIRSSQKASVIHLLCLLAPRFL